MRSRKPRQKSPEKKHRHEHETWPQMRLTASMPRDVTWKTMHHPATRIGEVRRGKS